MELFISNLTEKCLVNDSKEESCYMHWIESFNAEQFSQYVKLLQIEGSNFILHDDVVHSPLFFHLKQEFFLASLTGGSTSDKIAKRVEIIFSTFTTQHGKALCYNDDFWSLIFKYPEQSAKSLKTEVLSEIAKNTKRHKVDFAKMIPFLPSDQLLADKLNAIAPLATPDIESVLKSKALQLNFIPCELDDSPVKRSAIKKEVSQKIKDGLKTPKK